MCIVIGGSLRQFWVDVNAGELVNCQVAGRARSVAFRVVLEVMGGALRAHSCELGVRQRVDLGCRSRVVVLDDSVDDIRSAVGNVSGTPIGYMRNST